MENHELAKLLIRGDVDAFNKIYWAHHQSIYANILKITKDSIAAEDILQEVFMTLWVKRTTIQPDQSLVGWLFKMSFNKSVSYLRIQLKKNILFDNVISHDIVVEEKVVDEEARYDSLYKAIDKLSPQKKRVFQLCKIEGKTYQEAAEEMQISKHTVKEYLSGSIAFVQEYLAAHKEPLVIIMVASRMLIHPEHS